jgi:hypothetical protein
MTLLLLRTGAAEPSRQAPDPDGEPAAVSLDLERLDRSPADHTRKVKVFILMGQSNMVGMGDILPDDKPGTLAALTKKQKKYPFLLDNDGQWRIRQDVHYYDARVKKGSPLSAMSNNGKTIEWYAGKQYDDMANAKASLANLAESYPGYQEQGYEIVGFVWWQGHKDQNAVHASRYEQNLARLIPSLRKDYDAPSAKFVLATGCGNPGRTSFGLQIAEAQLAIADATKHPKFTGNVKALDVHDLWREVDASPKNQAYHYNRNAETFMEVGLRLGWAMADLLENKP